MSAEFYAGLGAAAAAAACYGAAPVAQTLAARSTSTGAGVGLALTVRLARRPIWLAGLGAEIGAFVLEAYAFSVAPATLVAPVASCDMLVFVLLASVALGLRWSRRAVLGAGAVCVGVGLLAWSLSGDAPLGRPAGAPFLLGCLVGCAVLVGLAALAGQRALDAGRRRSASIAFSAGSGIAYGVATLATRQIGRTFSADHPVHLLATPTPYVLVAGSVLAITMMQRGLQAGPLLTYPIASVVSAYLPVIVGAAALGDAVPGRGLRIAFVAALAVIGLGVAAIGADRSTADDDAGPRRSGRVGFR